MSTHGGHVTVMIISDSGRSPVSIKFSKTSFKIILGALGLLVVSLLVVLATYTTLLNQSMERARLLTEVEQLRRVTNKVDQLEQNLANYRVMLKKMTELAGIDLNAMGMSSLDSQVAGNYRAPVEQNAGVAQDARSHPIPSGYPVKGYISRSFRPEDENPRMRHLGIDLAVSSDTPVIATADGVVTYAGWDSTFGWKVILSHANDLETMYGHNDSLRVQVGDVKKFGETIAVSGSTGVSTAPHVHYEIRRGGVPINPEDYLDKRK
jgi:murein DD-endopeptidase MepM/ murein hydrolase activator NlpD